MATIHVEVGLPKSGLTFSTIAVTPEGVVYSIDTYTSVPELMVKGRFEREVIEPALTALRETVK